MALYIYIFCLLLKRALINQTHYGEMYGGFFTELRTLTHIRTCIYIQMCIFSSNLNSNIARN